MAPDDSVHDEPIEHEEPGEASEADTSVEPAEEKPAPVVDEVLLASVDLARNALLEITPAASIGEVVGSIAEEDHVLSLHFESKLAGYPGWHWTVTVSRIDESSEPSVLEIEMLPGENALIAPDWVPWSERLAEYTLAQELTEATTAADDDAESDDDELDDDDSDEDDDDDPDIDDGLDLDDGIDIDDHVTDDDELEAAAEEADGASDDDAPEDDDDAGDDDDDDSAEDDDDADDFDDDPHAEGPWSDR
ncbi:DUF3027 domain-containing protein [Herbiconiux sp. P16]|uniref:DUF3027 domain-containing protein n=1 Tax=Herbiconiux wuyangfengii TaxID=3342794 RepID=UPI0035BADA9B